MIISEINRVLQPKTRFIVENYLIPANERNASIDVMLLALYMQMSRFLCWNRVKVMGIKGYEYPMIYAFNFAKSGTYKDEVINSIINTIQFPLEDQAKRKQIIFDSMMAKYKNELETLKGEARKDYAMSNKPKRFHNTFKEGTIQALQKHRRAAQEMGIGHVHYEHDEFVDDFSRIDSNVKQILSLAKTAYQRGNSTSNTIIGEWRDNVEDVPLTFFLHSSADELMKNQMLFKNLLSILGTGIGKRAFILFDDKTIKVKRSEEEVELDHGFATNALPHVERMMTEAYLSIKFNHVPVRIESSKEVERRRNEYKNHCIDRVNLAHIDNELIRLEMYDRSWRAFRLANCIATLEHPENLTVMLPDYEWAIYLTDKWGNQFADFVLGECDLSIEQIYDFIALNPKTTKTIIRKKTLSKSTADLNYKINQVRMMADEKDKLFITEKGRGIAEYYSIIDRPESYDTIDSIMKTNNDPKVIEALREQYGDEVDIYLKANQK